MELNEYASKAMQTAIYPECFGVIYTSLNLAGEAGEYAGQVAKAFRDDEGVITPERREKLIKELGDCLWMIAACARELGVTLEYLANENLEKLSDRSSRGAISGSGDFR